MLGWGQAISFGFVKRTFQAQLWSISVVSLHRSVGVFIFIPVR